MTEFMPFITGRIAGIVFTHRPKIRFFAPQGRLVAPIHVKLGRTVGHVGPAWLCKISPQSPQGAVRMRPQKYQKFPLFDRVAPQGRLP